MEIKTVAIIGLGALGTMFGNHLRKGMAKRDLRIIADPDRIARYEREGIYCNGEACDFQYVASDEKCSPADLILVAVKYNQLHDAVEGIRNQVGPQTLILSLLNGISSEEDLGQAYGMDKVIYCVAQGMDAVKVFNQLTYHHMGKLCVGELHSSAVSKRVESVAAFLDRTGVPYETDLHMQKRLWGKFMLNVGVNQTVAVMGENYSDIQKDGPARELMIVAMREVIALSKLEGTGLVEDDLGYWLHLLGTLNPGGKPSMRQDVEAGRFSEVELFSGTVLRLAKKHGLATPVNQMLYDRIQQIEAQY